MSVLHQFWLSLMGHIFLLLCMLGNFFYWMSDIVNFTLLGAEYCIPKAPMELCSMMQLSLLETVWTDSVLLLWFVRRVWSNAKSGDNYSSLRSNPSDYSTQCLWLSSFHSSWRKQDFSPGLVWAPGTVNSHSFEWLFPSPEVVSSHLCSAQYSAEDSRRTLCRSLTFSLCVSLSSLEICPENSSCFGLSQLSAPSSRPRDSTRLLLQFLLPEPWPGSSLKAVNWGNCNIHHC